MSDDARLIGWLEATRAALAAPEDERGAALAALERTRAELEAALRAEPPAEIAPTLARQLEASECELAAAVDALRGSLAEQVGRLREARGVLRDYRPARPNRPAFVSKSV